jgi:murein DD-endopeptidase MepM/ murein hydrolase activator NlpD
MRNRVFMVPIAGKPGREHNARMDGHAAALACSARIAGALALLLTASCVSYEFKEQSDGSRLPQPVAKPAPSLTTAPLPPITPESTAAAPAGGDRSYRQGGVHRAKSGETAYSVARRYGVDAYTLITANNLVPPFELYEGQRVVIPRTAPATSAASADASPPEQSTRRPTPSVLPPANPAGQTAALPRPAPSQPPESAGGFDWPVEGSVISEFGPKGGGRYNDGINIAAPEGTPVRASESGVVAYAGNEVRGFGNMLLLKHAEGWVTAYAHNRELLVKRGERVRRGQVIARVGSSGSVDRPQLHFELRKGKQAVDPMRELPRPSAAARARDSG